jgi:hypothetical protein
MMLSSPCAPIQVDIAHSCKKQRFNKHLTVLAAITAAAAVTRPGPLVPCQHTDRLCRAALTQNDNDNLPSPTGLTACLPTLPRSVSRWMMCPATSFTLCDRHSQVLTCCPESAKLHNRLHLLTPTALHLAVHMAPGTRHTLVRLGLPFIPLPSQVTTVLAGATGT